VTALPRRVGGYCRACRGPAGTCAPSIGDVATVKTPLPSAEVLGEFAIVTAENGRRLVTDAENLQAEDGRPTAYSLAVLALEGGRRVLAVSHRPVDAR
jgi:hypothetical protein